VNEDRLLQCKNTLHFVAMFLSSQKKYKRCVIMAGVSEPAMVMHFDEQANLTTRANVLQYYSNLASGGYHGRLVDILRKFSDPVLLQKVGLAKAADFDIDARDRPAVATNVAVQSLCEDEAELAAEFWGFAFALYRHRALSLAHYDQSYPGLLALLCLELTRGRGLALCVEAWDAVEFAEAASRGGDASARTLLDNIPFVDWILFREIALSIKQFGGLFVPEPYLEMAMLLFSSWGHSCIDEEGFNRIKDHQRDSKTLRMSRLKRWIWPILTRVISDRYGRTELTAAGGSTVPVDAPRRLPESAFDAQAAAPGIPDELLQALKGRPTWHLFSPQSAHMIPAAWQLLLHCYRAHSFDAARAAWRSIFVPVGMVLEDVVLRQWFLVLHSSQFGCFALPVSFARCEDGYYMDITFPNMGTPQWTRITTFDDYRVYDLRPEGPNIRRWRRFQSPASCRHGLRLDGAGKSIDVASAETGFRGVTDPWLRKLCVARGMDAKDLPTTFSKVEALLRSLKPGLSEEEYASFMLCRTQPRARRGHSLLTDEALEVLTEALDPADKKAAKAEIDEHHAESCQAKLMRAYLHDRGMLPKRGGAGSAGVAAVPKAVERPRGRQAPVAPAPARPRRPLDLDLERAKTYLPTVVGCRLQDIPDKRAVQVFYPTGEYPRSKHYTAAAAGAAGYTRDQCLHCCLRWAWTAHQNANRGTPEAACPHPWIFGDAQDLEEP